MTEDIRKMTQTEKTDRELLLEAARRRLERLEVGDLKVVLRFIWALEGLK